MKYTVPKSNNVNFDLKSYNISKASEVDFSFALPITIDGEDVIDLTIDGVEATEIAELTMDGDQIF